MGLYFVLGQQLLLNGMPLQVLQERIVTIPWSSRAQQLLQAPYSLPTLTRLRPQLMLLLSLLAR
jgi:hypothetical protein